MSRRTSLSVLICLAIAIAIVLSNWVVISSASYEVGDPAANSLLIQSAKQFRLLTGNYSRIGFNHPGPAILYVLALGEFLFHDVLHLVGSPVGGQLMMAAFYSAFWIVMIAVLFHRYARNGLEAAVFTGVFCAVLAHYNFEIFEELWFPDLYVLPFAAFTVALAFLIQGETASYIPLALACGFLINGHVSFVFTTGVMLIGGFGANAWAHFASRGSPSASPFLLSFDNLRAARGRLAAAVLIIFAFLTPLAIKTVKNPPGPIHDYLRYSHSGHESNTWSASLNYLASYWSASYVIDAVIIVICVSAIVTLKDRFKSSFLSALLITSIAVLLYAKFGIDDLSYNYIALFYYACPALAIGMATVALYRLLAASWREAAAIAISLGCAFFLGSQLVRSPGSGAAYDDKDIPALFNQLHALDDKPYVMDLDSDKDWGNVWPTIVGVEVYGRRQHGPDFFCIRSNWHILFTGKIRCTDAQVAERKRYLVTAADDPLMTGRPPLLKAHGLNVYSESPPCLGVGESLLVADHRAIYSAAVLGHGWSGAESEFVWSDDQKAELQVCVRSGVKTLSFDLAAYLPNGDSHQTVSVFLSDKHVGDFAFDASSERGKRSIELPDSDGDQTLPITLMIEHPTSPKQEGQSDDDRKLGVAIYGIEGQ